MKKTIATYWPIAILVPIALAAYMHAMSAAEPAAAPREMTTAATVSAEAGARGVVRLRRARRRLDARNPDAGAKHHRRASSKRAVLGRTGQFFRLFV